MSILCILICLASLVLKNLASQEVSFLLVYRQEGGVRTWKIKKYGDFWREKKEGKGEDWNPYYGYRVLREKKEFYWSGKRVWGHEDLSPIDRSTPVDLEAFFASLEVLKRFLKKTEYSVRAVDSDGPMVPLPEKGKFPEMGGLPFYGPWFIRKKGCKGGKYSALLFLNWDLERSAFWNEGWGFVEPREGSAGESVLLLENSLSSLLPDTVSVFKLKKNCEGIQDYQKFYSTAFPKTFRNLFRKSRRFQFPGKDGSSGFGITSQSEMDRIRVALLSSFLGSIPSLKIFSSKSKGHLVGIQFSQSYFSLSPIDILGDENLFVESSLSEIEKNPLALSIPLRFEKNPSLYCLRFQFDDPSVFPLVPVLTEHEGDAVKASDLKFDYDHLQKLKVAIRGFPSGGLDPGIMGFAIGDWRTDTKHWQFPAFPRVFLPWTRNECSLYLSKKIKSLYLFYVKGGIVASKKIIPSSKGFGDSEILLAPPTKFKKLLFSSSLLNDREPILVRLHRLSWGGPYLPSLLFVIRPGEKIPLDFPMRGVVRGLWFDRSGRRKPTPFQFFVDEDLVKKGVILGR